MKITATDVPLSFPHNSEVRNLRLNPDAPEFFPSSKIPPNCLIFSPPTNPFFLRYPILPFLHPHVIFPAPLFFYTRQHAVAVQPHFFATDQKVSAAYASLPDTEPVSHLLQPKPFKAKTVLEEAQESRIVAREEIMGSTRNNSRDKRCRKHKRYGRKERFYSLQAHMKQWRAKPAASSDHCASDYKYVAKTVDQVSNVVRGRADNEKRKKHPPIPLKDDGKETTVMLRNIPNRYARTMLIDFLDRHCMTANKEADSRNVGADEEPSLSAFDFLYLPIDFVTKLNKGYAFVNFTNAIAARKFFDAWHDTHWDCFMRTNKIREISCAKLQGMEQLVKKFERMEFPSEDFQPLSFNPARDGSKQLVKVTVVGRH